jgi:ATP/maltotriose-dependent transcriptional regulator MalT
MGTVHVKQARYDLAERNLSAAADLGKRAKGSILHMCALLALTELWLARGETARARTVIAEAYSVLDTLGAAPLWLARLLALTAEAEDMAGDSAVARTRRQEALGLVGSTDSTLARSLRLTLSEGEADAPATRGARWVRA